MRSDYGGFGREWQTGIYLAGVSGKKPSLPVGPEAMEAAAKSKLPLEAYDYVAGGAGQGEVMKGNLEAFLKWNIIPKVLTDVDERSLSTKVLGLDLPAPVLFAPVGVLSIIHPEGELAVAKAASSLGIPYTLSTAASHSIEEVAGVMGDSPRWFQLYWGRDLEVSMSMVSRAQKFGYKAIVLTVDTRILGWRERDLQNAYLPFFKREGVANYLTDPVFRDSLGPSASLDDMSAVVRAVAQAFDPSLTWEDIKTLRDRTDLPILLKGVVSPQDALEAVRRGVNGIVVSNHGGRQLGGGIPALDALPSVVKAVDGKIPVLMDSGIRRGSDVLKAVALGAAAVLVGRPYVWGLALGGEEGVKEAMQNLLADLDISLGLSGIDSISKVGPGLVAPA